MWEHVFACRATGVSVEAGIMFVAEILAVRNLIVQKLRLKGWKCLRKGNVAAGVTSEKSVFIF